MRIMSRSRIGLRLSPSGGDQLGNLGFRQVLALPIFGILASTTTNCRLFRPRGP
jgi:hypothetical protein